MHPMAPTVLLAILVAWGTLCVAEVDAKIEWVPSHRLTQHRHTDDSTAATTNNNDAAAASTVADTTPADAMEGGNYFFRDGYPHLRNETRAVLDGLTIGRTLTLWDGTKRTPSGHMQWLHDHVRWHTEPALGGFRRTGEHAGVVYEMHDALTAKGDGAGYFRLTTELDVPADAFVSLLLHAPTLAAMDETVRAMDFAGTGSDGQTWLVYWRAAVGFPFWDVDGIDLTGWRRDEEDGTLWQISVSTPEEAPHAATASRGWDLFWGYKLVPIGEDGERTRMTLLCQTDLRNYVPKFLANSKIGEVLADYVRKAETTTKEYLADGRAQKLMVRFGLAKKSDVHAAEQEAVDQQLRDETVATEQAQQTSSDGVANSAADSRKEEL